MKKRRAQRTRSFRKGIRGVFIAFLALLAFSFACRRGFPRLLAGCRSIISHTTTSNTPHKHLYYTHSVLDVSRLVVYGTDTATATGQPDMPNVHGAPPRCIRFRHAARLPSHQRRTTLSKEGVPLNGTNSGCIDAIVLAEAQPARQPVQRR